MIHADLSGQTTLVTGGGSGIGHACVELFGRMGARVAANHLPGDDGAIAAIERLADSGLAVFPVPGDVSVPDSAERMVGEAIDQLGGLNNLVNNAGTSATREPIAPAQMDQMTEAFWQTILNTNLVGPFRCAHAAASALIESGGAIVNIASIAGLGHQGSSTAYSASKAGCVSLTRSLARALGPAVRVNAVAPGLTNTPWTASWPEARKQASRDKAALGRTCDPQDIAEAVLFLCAGAAMVTGHTLVVDGGMTL